MVDQIRVSVRALGTRRGTSNDTGVRDRPSDHLLPSSLRFRLRTGGGNLDNLNHSLCDRNWLADIVRRVVIDARRNRDNIRFYID